MKTNNKFEYNEEDEFIFFFAIMHLLPSPQIYIICYYSRPAHVYMRICSASR